MKNNLILSGLHLSLTGAHKEVVSTKMDKIFKHEEKIIRARIELERSSKSSSHENEFVAKGHLELKGTTITISSASDNIFKSIDDLVEKLDRGLRRRSRLKKVKRKQSSLTGITKRCISGGLKSLIFIEPSFTGRAFFMPKFDDKCLDTAERYLR